MKTPIFDISEPNDVLIFESKEKAERYIEATDLLTGNCLIVDSEGRALTTLPQANGSIIIEPSFSEPTHQVELHRALVDFFQALGENQEWLKRASLPELVHKSLEHKTE